MKTFRLLIATAVAATFGQAAFAAGQASTQFSVGVNLTTACTVITGDEGAAVSINYTAFQTTDGTGSSSPKVSCTRGLAPTTIQFDGTNGTTSAANATNITGEGLLSGLRYTLAASMPTVASGSAATAGAGGTGGSNGTADAYTFTVNVTVPKGQAGATSGSASHNRTLFINY